MTVEDVWSLSKKRIQFGEFFEDLEKNLDFELSDQEILGEGEWPEIVFF